VKGERGNGGKGERVIGGKGKRGKRGKGGIMDRYVHIMKGRKR
jgi:hypothetical protein